MSYSKAYLQKYEKKSSNLIVANLPDPWMDMFWKAFADERYFLMLHILFCKITENAIILRWFDKIPYFSARELLGLVLQDLCAEYYAVVGWIFQHITNIITRNNVSKALEGVMKVIELLNLDTSSNLFENALVVDYLSNLNLFDKHQNSTIKLILKQKLPVKYDASRLIISKVKILVRKDSKFDEVDLEVSKSEAKISFKPRIEFCGDPVCFDTTNLDGEPYIGLIIGYRKDNNELLIYLFDQLKLKLKNYHSRPFTILKFMKNTRFVVTTDMSFDIALWDFITGNCVAVWKFHSRVINSLLCLDSNLKIYSCSSDNSVRSFKIPQSMSTIASSMRRTTAVKQQKLIFSLNYPSSSAFCNEPITCISIAKINNVLMVAAGSNYVIRIYKEQNLKISFIIPINDFKMTHNIISSIVWIDETFNIYAVSKNQIKIVDINEKKVIKSFSDRNLGENKNSHPVVYLEKFIICPTNIESASEPITIWSADGKSVKRQKNSCNIKIKQILSYCRELLYISDNEIGRVILNINQ
eukprot:NODE_10_length_61504_cov_0.956502.p9 type:complete len:527 gc:universal NODE_10_length_61504_cov_0.956502:53378-51798(-)